MADSNDDGKAAFEKSQKYCDRNLGNYAEALGVLRLMARTHGAAVNKIESIGEGKYGGGQSCVVITAQLWFPVSDSSPVESNS